MDDRLFSDITPMVEAFQSFHEMFEGLLEAGFTERQAIQFVAEMIKQARPE